MNYSKVGTKDIKYKKKCSGFLREVQRPDLHQAGEARHHDQETYQNYQDSTE